MDKDHNSKKRHQLDDDEENQGDDDTAQYKSVEPMMGKKLDPSLETIMTAADIIRQSQ